MQRCTSVGRISIALGLFTAVSAGAAVVYKWTDTDGVVHFSDRAVAGAEKIITSGSASNGIGGSTRGPAVPLSGATTPGPLRYSRISIESPAPEQVYFGDDIVAVQLHLEPELQPNQSITWHLNGKQLNDQPPQATAITLQSLPRGTYAVAATLTDTTTGDSLSSDSVTFYVRQPSELAPQHKKS